MIVRGTASFRTADGEPSPSEATVSKRCGAGSATHPAPGDHPHFVEVFEMFLDAAYRWETLSSGNNQGRRGLVASVAKEMRWRGVRTVLDCAAGSGFPSIDLMADQIGGGLDIRCTDGNQDMIRVLTQRAKQNEIDPNELVPDRHSDADPRSLDEPLLLDWSELDQIEARFDYVMCRGNSLAYAGTWSGSRVVATRRQLKDYLSRMGDRVRAGGYLHVDAPWELGRSTRILPTDRGTITEFVDNDGDCRAWRVEVQYPDGRTTRFARYSARLTADDVKGLLDELGFEHTNPFDLPAERPGLGVVIARKPT